MALTKSTKLVILIFILVLLFRLFFVFQTPYYSQDSSYSSIRYTEHILSTGLPLKEDTLSYGGRIILYPPLFEYFLAFFNLFLPSFLAYKLIPAILFSLLVFVIFKITKEITKNENAALFATLMFALLPIIITETLNAISVYSLMLLIFFYALYCLIKIKEKKYLYQFIIASFILPLTDPSAILLTIALVFYAIIMNAESLNLQRVRKEAIVFSIFATILISFLIFKDAFLSLGPDIIKQNIPTHLLTLYFEQVSLLSIIISVGILPILFGIIGLTFGIFRDKTRSAYLIGSIILSTLLFLLLKTITIPVALIFLSIALTILSSLAISKAYAYFTKTKFHKFKNAFTLILLIVIIATLLPPCYTAAREVMANTPDKDLISTLLWIKTNTSPKSTILSPLEQGHLITGVAERKNVADDFYLLAPSVSERTRDIDLAYTTELGVKAIDILKPYSVDYILFSDKAKNKYKLTTLGYAEDGNCFKKAPTEIELYEIIC